MGRPARGALALGLLVLGLVVGIATTAVHPVGWALVLGLAATVTTAYVVPGGWGTRLPFGLGWVATIAYFSNPRAEGDYLISADLNGYLLLGSGLVLLVASIVTVRPLRRQPRQPPSLD